MAAGEAIAPLVGSAAVILIGFGVMVPSAVL
jgi:hypothetical protein